MKNLLPSWLSLAITKEFPEVDIQELRLRLNKPLQINFKGRFFELNISNGLKAEKYIVEDLISYIISVATKQSLYAFADQIKHGFIATDNGIRIGLCGTAVYDSDNNIAMLKKITSLNIRFGHHIYGCANNVIKYLINDNLIKNTLIISPPGAGKTTLLRDIVYKLSEEYNLRNILVVDERFELAGFGQDFNLGNNVDIISGSTKSFAFKEGLKVMNPTIIITDEISYEDIEAIKLASKSGVFVIATAHASNVDELKKKKGFNELIVEGCFETFIVLSKRNGVGTIEGVYNKFNQPLYIPYLIWKA